MQKVKILRTSSSNEGTLGVLVSNNFTCRTGELPWRNNKSNLSCIPVGKYKCTPYNSRKFGRVYLINNVSKRSAILFHPGNVFGNRQMGYKTHSWGCILLGKYNGKLEGQDAVLVSRPTVRKFFESLNYQEFELEIKNIYT